MNKYTIYSEFLNHSYKKILQACLEDEAIDTLKILENKDYLLLRINQLFSQVYVAQREKLIEEQGKMITVLHQNSQSSKYTNQSRKCTNCQLLMEHISQLQEQNKALKLTNDQNDISQERNVKKIQSMLLKQVQSLKNEVKRLQEQNIYKKIQFEEEKSSIQRQNAKMKQQLKEQKEKQSKLLQKLKTKMRQATQEKNILQNQVFNNLELRANEERQLRQMTSKFSDLTITREKLQNQLNYLRNQSNITQQRLNRVEEQNKFLREKDTLSQKQIKRLKLTNDKLKDSNEKLQQKLQQNSQKNAFQDSEQKSKDHDHLRWTRQFEKKMSELKMKFSEREIELVQKNLQSQKIIMKLTDQLRKAQTKLDRQIKCNKDEIKQQASKTIQQKQSQWKEEKEQLLKKYEKLFSQKEKLCDRLQQKIISMNRNLTQAQSSFNSQCRELQQQKIRLLKQIQIEKNNYHQVKKYYSSNKNTQEAIIKDFQQKYNEIISQKQQLQKSLSSKQKQIKQFKRQILKQSQAQNILQIKLEQFRHKYTSCNQLLDEQKSTIRILTDRLKQKQKSINQLNKNLQQLNQQLEQKEKALQTLKLSEKRLNDKNYRLQQLINEKRQLLHKIHEQNQLEVVDVFSKAQQTTAEARKQLQSYYVSLLKTTEDKNSKYNTLQAEKIQQKELQSLKYKKQEIQQKMRKYKDKYQKQQLENSSKQAKINDLIRENEQLKIEVNRMMDTVHQQKRKNINTIKSYQQKMLEYYNNFSQFKRQFYLSIKQQFKQLKKQLITIYQLSQSYKNRFRQMCLQMGQKFIKQNEMIKQRSQLQLQKLRHQYEYDIIFKLQEEKKEIKMQYQMKLKQQSMQFYTIIAQKQYQIKSSEEKEHQITLKITELQQRSNCSERASREAIKKNQQLKQIINKMNNKVAQAERASSNCQNELEYYKKANLELKKQINQLETTFKTKIEQCREKYSQQNERLFNKYEKQFSKFIVSNKKSLQFTMLSNSCSNLHIPTKGLPSEGKLDKIQRQIQQQKKKLNNMQKQMDTKSRFEKPQKATLDKDTIKNEKYKKY